MHNKGALFASYESIFPDIIKTSRLKRINSLSRLKLRNSSIFGGTRTIGAEIRFCFPRFSFNHNHIYYFLS